MVQSGVSVEDEVMETLTRDIQKEIDQGVMLEILVQSGWTKVPYHFINGDHAVDVMMWLENTPKKNWKRLSGSFVFKKACNAEWFLLRWV